MKKSVSSLLRKDGFQTLLASLVCILGGLIVGWLVLLAIEPSGAFGAITAVMKSFFRYPGALKLKYFGQTLVRTVPLLMCALSVLFAYKVGMFNIGVAGQYVAGACAGLYAALAWELPWYLCLIIAMTAGALLLFAVGASLLYRVANTALTCPAYSEEGVCTGRMLYLGWNDVRFCYVHRIARFSGMFMLSRPHYEMQRRGAPPVVCLSMPDTNPLLLAYLTYCPHAEKGD